MLKKPYLTALGKVYALKSWRWAAIFLLLIAGALFAGSLFFPAEYQICGANEYTHQKECTQHHGGPFVLLWVAAFLDGHNGLVTAIATIVIAGFTWALSGSTKKLWIAGEKQAQTTEILQRAYLSADIAGVMHVGPEGHDANVDFKNVGRLPATKVRWFVEIEMCSDGRRELFPIGPLVGKNVIPPGATMTQSTRTVFSDAETKNFNGGAAFIYVWGCVTYSDGFNVQRTTHFCHRYDRTGRKMGTEIAAGFSVITGRYHIHGNDAD